MLLTITKVETGGVSRINRATVCAFCKKFTDETTGPAVDIRMWLDTPRGADTHGARLLAHTACLQQVVVAAEKTLQASAKL